MARSAAIERVFNPGDKVLVRDYRLGHSRWRSAVIVAAMGVKMYEVQCDNGGLWKRHTDQIQANPMGLELKDPPNLRGLTEEADGTPGAQSGAASNGGTLPQPCPLATEAGPAASGGGTLPQPRPPEPCSEAVPAPEDHPRAPEMSGADRRPECGSAPVIKTRSGRVVKKPTRYADSGN